METYPSNANAVAFAAFIGRLVNIDYRQGNRENEARGVLVAVINFGTRNYFHIVEGEHHTLIDSTHVFAVATL